MCAYRGRGYEPREPLLLHSRDNIVVYGTAIKPFLDPLPLVDGRFCERAETIPFPTIPSLHYLRSSRPSILNLSTFSKNVYGHNGVLFCSRLRCEPFVSRYSMFRLPPTLRAVQGATPYVRHSIKALYPWEILDHSILLAKWSITLLLNQVSLILAQHRERLSFLIVNFAIFNNWFPVWGSNP